VNGKWSSLEVGAEGLDSTSTKGDEQSMQDKRIRPIGNRNCRSVERQWESWVIRRGMIDDNIVSPEGKEGGMES